MIQGSSKLHSGGSGDSVESVQPDLCFFFLSRWRAIWCFSLHWSGPGTHGTHTSSNSWQTLLRPPCSLFGVSVPKPNLSPCISVVGFLSLAVEALLLVLLSLSLFNISSFMIMTSMQVSPFSIQVHSARSGSASWAFQHQFLRFARLPPGLWLTTLSFTRWMIKPLLMPVLGVRKFLSNFCPVLLDQFFWPCWLCLLCCPPLSWTSHGKD